MPGTEPSRRRPASVAALVAVVLAAAGWLLAGPASAAPQDMFLQLNGGTVGVGDSDFELPGEGGFNGTWDDETGALAGSLTLPTVLTSVTSPVAADVTLTFESLAEVTGTVDPDTGAASVAASVRIGISVNAGGTVLTEPDCGVEPIALDLTGTFDFAADTLVLSAAGFTIPPSTGCGAAVGPIIDGFLAGDTTATLSFDRVAEQVTTTTTTTTTSTTTTTEASTPTPPSSPRAEPVQRPARFTG